MQCLRLRINIALKTLDVTLFVMHSKHDTFMHNQWVGKKGNRTHELHLSFDRFYLFSSISETYLSVLIVHSYKNVQ